MSAIQEEAGTMASTESNAFERRWAVRCCFCAPLFGLAAWAFAARYLLTIVYLHPPEEVDFAAALRWKPALACAFTFAALPVLWLAGLELERRFRRRRLPLAALLALAIVAVASSALEVERIRWFFVEWAKIRTPNPSFGRNTLLWEARDFEQRRADREARPNILLVGSSQIYHAVDMAVVAGALPRGTLEKNALAGFGPLQYLWLHERLMERRPDIVVTWLSEFDFFREDVLPIERLRWSSSRSALSALLAASGSKPIVDPRAYVDAFGSLQNWPAQPDDLWSQRAGIADLAAAAVLPLWRNRDHVQRTLFGYWWNVSVPASADSGGTGGELPAAPDLEIAVRTLRQNVGRKRFVDANFTAFSMFARRLANDRIPLVVFEGASHPVAMQAYDPALRLETRRRLEDLASRGLLTYIPSDAVPVFDDSDFADAYHLDRRARHRFSLFLAQWLRPRFDRGPLGSD